MYLDEAIEILTIDNDHNPDFTDAEREQARQLGIEALRRLQWYRKYHRIDADTSLLGETKE